MIRVQSKQRERKEGEIRLGGGGKIPLDGGINLQSQESAIKLNQSPFMENVNGDDQGTLIGRMGQMDVINLGAGGIKYVYPNYKGYTIIAHGTKLYKLEGNTTTQIYSGLAGSKAFLFVFNGILYIKTDSQYLQYDGTTVKEVEPYIPTITQGRKPDGSQSTLYEPLNLLGDWFTDSFSSDGTAVYNLSFKPVEAVGDVFVNGSKVTNYTVDLTNGKVTFSEAIAQGAPNNVTIQAKKSNPEGKQAILKCTYGVEFASSMWLAGNPDSPNKYWRTGLTDKMEANYFPATGYRSFDVVSGIDEAITAFIPHYDKLIILKEKSTWYTYAETRSDGLVWFPIKRLNSNIGCDIPGSVQLINNNPVFCNTYGGVYIVVSTMLEGEKNVLPVSNNINGLSYRPGLLQESNLKEASSFDDGRKYYLCVGDKVYVWDYFKSFDVSHPENLVWYPYTNIKAKQFYSLNNETYYGHRDEGRIVKFIEARNDFGQPIKQVWKSKLLDFDHPDYLKTVKDIWITTRANTNSSFTIKYFNDELDMLDIIEIPKAETNSFSFSNFSFSNFTFKVLRYAPTIHRKIRAKKIRYFQIELSNEAFNESLSILSIVLKYSLDKRIK